jgi:DNA-binding LytR/AlgR family response regulator
MWEIVICDSDEVFVERVEETVTSFYAKREMEIHIQVYPDGYTIIPAINEPMDVIFLSTRLSDVSGFCIAALLRTRRLKRDSKIVFLGEEDGDVFESFTYQPFSFIRKCRWESEAEDVLSHLWACDHRERSVQVMYQRKRKQVRVSSIMYIEAYGHSLTVWCTKGESYRFHGRMAEYEERLKGYYFVHSAKSYLVNCAYVHGIKDTVQLKNGFEIPCSKSCSTKTRQMWYRYMQEMARAL